MKPEEYLLVESRISQERENVNALLEEMRRLGLYPGVTARQIGGFDLTDQEAVRILGSMLQDFYTFFENIARTVASRTDKSMPAGDDWHREILNQMTLPVPGVRPAVFSRNSGSLLEPYRGFRHVFRNAYGFQLDGRRIAELVQSLPAVVSSVERDLDEFVRQMRKAEKLPRP